MSDKEFPKGIMFKPPRQGAPDFIRGSISIKVDEFTQYIEEKQKNGWVNFDLKLSKNGKMYIDLNDWTPGQSSGGSETQKTQTF